MKTKNAGNSGGKSNDFVNLLKALNEEEKVVIGLHFYEELSPEHVATILCRDKEYIQKVIDTVLSRLQTEMAKFQDPELLSRMTI